MQVLVHYKKQQLEKFISALVELNELDISKSYDLSKSLADNMNTAQNYFQQIGDSTNESTLSQLKIYLETALSGIDPIKLEKVKIGRRANITIAAFHCLTELNNVFRSSLITVNETLTKSTETLNQLVLSALQAKLITEKDLIESDSIEKITIVWQNLTTNEQIRLVEKKLKMELLPQDIYLLVDQIFEKIKNQKS